MLTMCREGERRVRRVRDYEVRSTFGSKLDRPGFSEEFFALEALDELHLPPAPLESFFALEALDELRLPPGALLPARLGGDADVVRYVNRGAITLDDAAGRSGSISVGQVHRQDFIPGTNDRDTNASTTSWAHVFRMEVHTNHPDRASTSGPLLFTIAERRNVLCVLASGDARHGSVRLRADVLVGSSLLDRGHHLVHPLLHGHGGWLHVVSGEARVNGVVMVEGDGVGVTTEHSLSVTAVDTCEVLLVDVINPGSPPDE